MYQDVVHTESRAKHSFKLKGSNSHKCNYASTEFNKKYAILKHLNFLQTAPGKLKIVCIYVHAPNYSHGRNLFMHVYLISDSTQMGLYP